MPPDKPGNPDPVQLTPEQQQLLDKHLPFYRDLETGRRRPTTPAQEHFVSFTRGLVPADTEHERAYAQHMRLRAQSRHAEQGAPPRDPAGGPTEEWFSREDWEKLHKREYSDIMRRARGG
jgi:uncharacterized protein YifE (UPF0438 family)